MNIKEFLNHFNNVKQSGTGKYMALCPCHNDRKNSLSISETDDYILLHCFAGCDTKAILERVGLSMKDLYSNNAYPSDAREKGRKTEYPYYDEKGRHLYTKIRTDDGQGNKKFTFIQPNGTCGVKGVRRVLFNLPNVLTAKDVFFVEGEKCAQAVIEAGMVATTLDSGSNSKWRKEFSQYLEDKNVFIIPDNDVPGFKYAAKILKHLPDAKVKMLPGLPEKGDIYDWLKEGHTMDEVLALPDGDLSQYLSEQPIEISEKENDKNTNSRDAIPERILKMAMEKIDVLLSDPDGPVFAAVQTGGHQEVRDISTSDFNSWLYSLYLKSEGKTVKQDYLSQVVAALRAQAKFGNGIKKHLENRVAKYEQDFWYDLTNDSWQAVRITKNGWTIENNPPAIFKRYNHALAQVNPVSGGNVRKIFDYINIKQDKTLFLCWLISCFIPDIPHAMPIFFGDKGSAKTTCCQILKKIIDPSVIDTIRLPKKEQDFVIQLQQHWFLPYDNLSYLPIESSDLLCTAITGAGIQYRKLYTDNDLITYSFKRCIALNGINTTVSRPDLLDRAVLFELYRIPKENRREYSAIMEDFAKDLPLILGGIFDILCDAMKIYPSIPVDESLRMADFTRWGCAICEALMGSRVKFMEEYNTNQDNQSHESINADIIGSLIRSFMVDKSVWEGKVSDLLNELSKIAPENGVNVRSRDFPKQPNQLSKRINYLKTDFQAVGIVIEAKKKNDGSYFVITNNNFTSPPPSQLPPYVNQDGEMVDDINPDGVIF